MLIVDPRGILMMHYDVQAGLKGCETFSRPFMKLPHIGSSRLVSAASWLRILALLACMLCLGVVILGAYVRLSDAGLGCPDWPGCYGHVSPAGAAADLAQPGSAAAAIAARSGRPLELGKAWREMLHRYAAATLAVLIALIAAASLRWRAARLMPVGLGLALLGSVLLQAAFGMLTVTWRLQPLIVTLHLIFGLTTLSLLWWLVLGLWRDPTNPGPAAPRGLRTLATVALLALAAQLALGGWTSSNYAALACPDLPTCQGSWWPPADFHAAFRPWRGLEFDAPGNMHSAALIAIQFVHRVGALATSVVLLLAALATLRASGSGPVRLAAWGIITALGLQLAIAASMILKSFPLELATAHNAGASLLLLATLALNRTLRFR